MLCSLYRWFLSRSVDLNKPVPTFLTRHRMRCPSCQEFSDFCLTLKPKAARDFKSLLEKTSISPPTIIELQSYKTPETSTKKPFLISSLSTAAAVLVVFICLLWFTFFPVEDRDLPPINLSSLSLEKAALNIEDPYEAEYIKLKHTIKSTTDFLASCLDIKIGDSIE